jgi:hypothetical protein
MTSYEGFPLKSDSFCHDQFRLDRKSVGSYYVLHVVLQSAPWILLQNAACWVFSRIERNQEPPTAAGVKVCSANGDACGMVDDLRRAIDARCLQPVHAAWLGRSWAGGWFECRWFEWSVVATRTRRRRRGVGVDLTCGRCPPGGVVEGCGMTSVMRHPP